MIALLVVLTSVSAFMRLIPFLFAHWLTRSSALSKLSATLPLCISILLVAHLLEHTPFAVTPYGIPELTALAAVIATQLLFRTLLISMAVGVCLHQLLLHIL